MNAPFATKRVDELVELQVLAHMHGLLREEENASQYTKTSNISLADAFSEFIATSSRLETSYRALQREVSRLDRELAVRNADLSASLRQNESIRKALQQIMDSMPCGVIVVECDGTISHMNPESRRLLNLTNDQTTVDIEMLAVRNGLDIKTISSDSSEQEIYFQSPAGDLWFALGVRRIKQNSTVVDQTILTLRDVTAHKRAELERESNRNAKALAEVATILAHEVRNPLASMELFVDLLEPTSKSQQRWISNLRAGIRTLSATVNNVLALNGSGPLQLAPTPIAALIAEAIQLMQPLADQAEVDIEWTNETHDLLLNTNQSALQQVLINLISNAIRHTPPDGKISITLHGSEGEAIIDCSDNGCGVVADQIAHLFEPGFSGRNDTCGLGLAVCARIVEQHQGQISVSNLLPSGANFRVELPISNLTGRKV